MRRRKTGEPRILSAEAVRDGDAWLLRWTEDDGTGRPNGPVREMRLETRGKRSDDAAARAQREAATILGVSLRTVMT